MRLPLVCASIVALSLVAPPRAAAQGSPPAQSQARRISVTWTQAPLLDVLQAFAAFSGRSIVAGASVAGFVTADINDEPWDVALRTILTLHGLVAVEDEYGIIRVDDLTALNDREAVEPVVTRTYRIAYARATELQPTIQALLSERGSVSAVASTNTLVVSDVARVQRVVQDLLR